MDPFFAAMRTLPLVGSVLVVAACGSTSQGVTSPTSAKCAVAAAASTTSFGPDGGTGQLTISTERECRWAASADVPWITLRGLAEGQGSASIEFAVARAVDPVARSGALRVGDRAIQIQQGAAACRFELSATAATVPSSGAGRDVDVTASNALCEWTARAEADWISIKAGASGRGNGRVTFEATPTTGPPRTGVLVVAGQRVTVTQSDGCVYTISPAETSISSSGGPGSVSVATAAECPWSAAVSAEWLAIGAGKSGTGPGTVQFSATANTGPARSTTLSVAGQAIRISQASGCRYTISPAQGTYPAAGAAAAVAVEATPGCPWSATGGTSWLTFNGPTSGASSGTVHLSVAPNTGPARSATLTIAGHPFAATQESGCSYSIAPSEAAFPSRGGRGTVAVTTVTGCPWTATSHDTWLSLLTTGGTGPGTVSFDVAPSSYEPRTGRLTIAGHVFTASQASGCTIELSASSASFGPEGGAGAFQVTTDCRWKTVVEGGAGWITLTRGDLANGSGPVTFTVAPNDGPARNGSLLIEDKYRFAIHQAGRQ